MRRMRPLEVDVLTATRARVAWAFDRFERLAVSFSGGKDSTVLLHLVAEEARLRGRRFTLVFIDWEAQYRATIRHVEAMFERYADIIDPMWIALPLRTTNACSAFEPEWTCWDPARRDLWVRDLPAGAITRPEQLTCYRERMTFEELIAVLGDHIGQGEMVGSFVGIRTVESLNRYRALARDDKGTLDDRPWTSPAGERAWNVYPIYDWRTADIWTWHAQTGAPYNPIYDQMWRAGLSIHQMRICEPYGDEQRRGLWLYHILEPESWARVVARVAGANTGALYAGEPGNIMGNTTITLPPGHSWRSYADFLLATMPAPTAEHYQNKIAVYRRWWQVNRDLELPDSQPGDCGARDVPSWRRVCKMLLKNDYWAKTLCFSPQKTAAQARYQDIMRRRRAAWEAEREPQS